MGKQRVTKEFVTRELPYRLLMQLYQNSRASLKELGRELNVSYHTVAQALKELEEKHKIAYTLELDEDKLGFSQGKIITVKFARMPSIDVLKGKLLKDIYIQDAYLSSGDFDLLLYVVGLTPREFFYWQFNFRKDFSEYRPLLKSVNLSYNIIGFFPLRNELLMESKVLSKLEKNVLMLLNENSRIKLSDLIGKSKASQMRVIYTLKKLREAGIIKKFTALTQNTDKKVLLAYGVSVTFDKNHRVLALNRAKEYFKEDLHEITNDYCVVADTDGLYDTFFICTFRNGEEANKKGHTILENLWASESPKIDKAILTDIFVGKWPFHLESYEGFKREFKELQLEVSEGT